MASPNTRRSGSSGRRWAGSRPGAGQGADDEALAGARRADEGLEARAGGEDPGHGGGLVDAELDALAAEVLDEPVAPGSA